MKASTKNMAKGVAVSAGIALAVISIDKAFGISDKIAAKIPKPAAAK